MATKLSELKKPAAGETDEATAAGKMPTKTAVRDLSKDVLALDQKIAKARGEKGSRIKTASTDHNIHKGAFREAQKQLAMEPEERANYQRHVAAYVLAMGVAYQGDLFKDAGGKAPGA